MTLPRTRFGGTLFLLLACVAVQVADGFLPGLSSALAFSASFPAVRALFTLVTHLFAHGGWDHLLGNFSFGLPFMLYLEHRVGKGRLLELFLSYGFCSAALQTLLAGTNPMLGSSGAVFGCAVAACVEFGSTSVDHALGIALAAVLLLPQIASAPIGNILGIAVYGHVGGALGALLLKRCK